MAAKKASAESLNMTELKEAVQKPADLSQEEGVFIFCYGCHGPTILADRIKVPKEEILKRTYAAEARGWIRAFCNSSPRWEDTSPATILKEEDGLVIGLVVRMTLAEVALLDPFEGYPDWYGRYPLDLHVFGFDQATTEPKIIQAQAYIQNEQNTFKEPSDAYKIKCCHTMFMHRQLRGQGNQKTILMPIINAMD